MYTQSLDVLRCKKKTTAACPFTQWYCWSGCALAIKDGKNGSWRCGLNDGSYVRYISYVKEEDELG